MFDGKRCRKSLGLEKLAVGRYDLLPLRGTANSPPTFMVYWPRAPMPDGKRCKMSLGLEPSLRAGSLYAYGIIKIGRNALAFLGNAAFKHRLRTAWGSIHGIIKIGRNALAFLGNAAFKHRLRTAWGSVHGILYPGFLCLKASDVKALGDIPGIRKALM